MWAVSDTYSQGSVKSCQVNANKEEKEMCFYESEVFIKKQIKTALLSIREGTM